MIERQLYNEISVFFLFLTSNGAFLSVSLEKL